MKRRHLLPIFLAFAGIALILILARLAPAPGFDAELRQEDALTGARANDALSATEKASSNEVERAPVPAVEPPPRVEATSPEAAPSSSPHSSRITIVCDLTDASGRAIEAEGFGATITGEDGEQHVSRARGGRCVAEGFEPGHYVLYVGGEGFRSIERRVTLRAGEPIHREVFAFDATWTLAVELRTPEGENLREQLRASKSPVVLDLVATLEPPGERIPRAFVRQEAYRLLQHSFEWWTAKEPEQERVEILVEPPIHLSVILGDHVLATQRIATRLESATFTIRMEELRSHLATLRMRLVVGSTGMPPPGSPGMLVTPRGSMLSLRQDDDGSITVDGLAPGVHGIFVNAKDCAPFERSVEVPEGAVVDLGTIVLEKGRELGGVCLDSENRPRSAPGTIVAVEEGRTDHPSRFVYSLEFDSENRFSVSSLEPGQYLIEIPGQLAMGDDDDTRGPDGGPWIAVPMSVDLRERSVTDLVIRLSAPVPLVLRPTAEAVSGMKFVVSTTEGLSAKHGSFHGLAAQRVELAPGAYSIRLTREARVVREIPIEIRAQPVVVDVMP